MAPHTQRSVGVRVDVSDDMRVFVLLGGSCKLSGQTFSLVCESCYTHLQRVCGGTVSHRFVLFNWRATRRCIHQHIWFLVGKGYQRRSISAEGIYWPLLLWWTHETGVYTNIFTPFSNTKPSHYLNFWTKSRKTVFHPSLLAQTSFSLRLRDGSEKKKKKRKSNHCDIFPGLHTAATISCFQHIWMWHTRKMTLISETCIRVLILV